MKFLTFLTFALFTVGAQAVKGSNDISRLLRSDNPDGDCEDTGTYTVEEGDCEICSRCNKETLTSVSFKYNPAGMNSRYQSTDFATCVEGAYPATTTVEAAGQTFANIAEGSEFTLLVPNGSDKFDANTAFVIGGVVECTIHLSCSAPIVAGDQIGPFIVLGKETCDAPGDCAVAGCLICDPDTKEFPDGSSRKPEELTFIYRSNGMDSLYQPDGKATCRAANVYPSSTVLTVEGQTFSVSDGDQFTVVASSDGFPAELDFSFDGGDSSCFIHASCSVPIIVGDQIGAFEVVGDSKSCLVCDDVCIKVDKNEYNCGEPITIDFDITTETDGLGQTGPLPSDWIGIYPCNVPYSDATFRFGIVNKYVCDQFTEGDQNRCSLDDITYPSGTVVIDRLPAYGEVGPYIWPVTGFNEAGVVNNRFKAVIMRDDGPSVPPYIPICQSDCFTIIPDATTQECEVRDNPVELNPTVATPFCFPGDAIVDVEGQGKVSMKDIRLGDKVLTDNTYETVYSFGHRNEAATAEFVKLVTAATSLDLSKDHLVYVNGAAVPASIVKVGDSLQLADGSLSPVRSIKTSIKKGVYAPFTASGAIVVNGVKASTFIAFQESATIHVAGVNTGLTFQLAALIFEFPHRMYCLHLSSCDTETYTTEGVSTWVNAGHKMFLWLFAQNFAVVATTIALMAVVCSSIRIQSIQKKL
eukprot:CAMPEP_0119015952 /NCGR_PEP_ID=MMETSP1176-20130426/11738_1 /TAXON_ID=265551 /ORGANISM="Synedropsis recta cf, Strain CCMP1620" /LENGTH=695 /DNA_ID=CAMNT_0006969277 /DNA_START=33 /DNA_END=2120 /DNA_ORIENTATION=+